MWKRIVDTGKRIFSSLINFLSRSNYNKTIINSILKWFPYIIGSIVTAVVAVLYSKIFDYSVSVSKLVKHNFPWLFFIITPCVFACRMVDRKKNIACSIGKWNSSINGGSEP